MGRRGPGIFTQAPWKDERMAKANALARAVHPRWPFTVKLENVLGLYAATGSWAKASGRLRLRLEIDTNIFVTAPPPLAEYVLYHEATHVGERHGLVGAVVRVAGIGLLAFLVTLAPWEFLPGFAFSWLLLETALRGVFEARADAAAARCLTRDRFVAGLLMSYTPPRPGFRGVFDRIVYGGSDGERARRIGVRIDPALRKRAKWIARTEARRPKIRRQKREAPAP